MAKPEQEEVPQRKASFSERVAEAVQGMYSHPSESVSLSGVIDDDDDDHRGSAARARKPTTQLQQSTTISTTVVQQNREAPDDPEATLMDQIVHHTVK